MFTNCNSILDAYKTQIPFEFEIFRTRRKGDDHAMRLLLYENELLKRARVELVYFRNFELFERFLNNLDLLFSYSAIDELLSSISL